MSHTILQTHKLSIGYKHPRRPPQVVAADISVSLQGGELVCLLGPNGGGKSTLMRTLAGLQAPLAGAVKLAGKDIHHLRPRELARCLSIVLTDRIDVGMLSAYTLVALGRHPYTDWTGQLSQQDEAVVRWAIEAVGAADLAVRQVGELSDGERQKIMIARALAQESGLILLDEPTAFLDLPHRVDIMGILRKLAREAGRAVLLSTHDLDLALRSADKIWLLPLGDPLQVGAPEDLVLSGAFEATFRSGGVVFDPHTGSFRLNQQQSGLVNLIGDGLPALWTKRALEREGFEVTTTASWSAIRVEVMAQNGHSAWRVGMNDVEQDCSSVYDLISMLRLNVKTDKGKLKGYN